MNLPILSYQEWQPTKDTLHLYAQVVGKVKLAVMPPLNHWWNVSLRIGTRGITTGPMPDGDRTFQIDFDLIEHELEISTSAGENSSFPLRDGLSVAAFYKQTMAGLAELGITPVIRPVPYGVPMTTPFPDDDEHHFYDADAVHAYWRTLDWTRWVMTEFAGWFCGKTSPVQLFWHSFDLAVTRFSGRIAPPIPGANPVEREAYSREVISFGFWAGDEDTQFPAFFSYTAPEPDGLRQTGLSPAVAAWQPAGEGSLAILPYEAVAGADDPKQTLLAFFQSAYQAGASTAGWPEQDLRSNWCPPEARGPAR